VGVGGARDGGGGLCLHTSYLASPGPLFFACPCFPPYLPRGALFVCVLGARGTPATGPPYLGPGPYPGKQIEPRAWLSLRASRHPAIASSSMARRMRFPARFQSVLRRCGLA
jgi:hypothetical protein